MIGYTNYTNLDASYMRPYQQGDRLVRGYIGMVDERYEGGLPIGPRILAEWVYTKHNRDDRPDGQMCPSMSIGDVVVFNNDEGFGWSVDVAGFVWVELDPADLITNRSWKELVK